MSARSVVRFSRPSDLVEGTALTGPKPRGWRVRFAEGFTQLGKNDCWEWTGVIQNNGYGTLSIANRPYLAHRLAFVLAHGKIDPDLLVMHSCDNRRCVNWHHLSQGTDADNIKDAWRKGRLQKGETNGMSKLTEKEVLAIKEKYGSGSYTMAQLAEDYGVWPPCIWRILRGLRWKHL